MNWINSWKEGNKKEKYNIEIRLGTFTILGNSVEFLQKNPTQVIFAADASVKGAAVGFAG